MRIRRRFIALGLVVLAVIVLAGWYLSHQNIPLLETRGVMAQKERNLMLFAAALSLVVVIPVFAMAIFIAWKYREGNEKAAYTPDYHNGLAEITWWVLPGILITILSVVAWNSSHTLDPFQPIKSDTPTLHVQVVALDWKWLFIYPQQHIASINQLEIPVNTPVAFDITSDAPMNSFWIPQLAGQIYAMPGMSTQLHIMASQTGAYNGSSANISGIGFAGMDFVTDAVTTTQFNEWVHAAKHAPDQLTKAVYSQLAKPSQNNPHAYYSYVDPSLYTMVIDKYMMPSTPQQNGNGTNNSTTEPAMSGMSM